MSNLSVAHAALSMVLNGFGPLPDFLMLVLKGTFEAVHPALDLLVPSVVAVLAHRWIKNQTLADEVSQASGIAYNHLGATLAGNGAPSFAVAKALAIQVAQDALTAGAATQMAKLSPELVADKIDGALGRLLAVDPNFSLAKGVLSPTPEPVVVRTTMLAVDPNLSLTNGVLSATPEPGVVARAGMFDATAMLQAVMSRAGSPDAAAASIVSAPTIQQGS